MAVKTNIIDNAKIKIQIYPNAAPAMYWLLLRQNQQRSNTKHRTSPKIGSSLRPHLVISIFHGSKIKTYKLKQILHIDNAKIKVQIYPNVTMCISPYYIIKYMPVSIKIEHETSDIPKNWFINTTSPCGINFPWK